MRKRKHHGRKEGRAQDDWPRKDGKENFSRSNVSASSLSSSFPSLFFLETNKKNPPKDKSVRFDRHTSPGRGEGGGGVGGGGGRFCCLSAFVLVPFFLGCHCFRHSLPPLVPPPSLYLLSILLC